MTNAFDQARKREMRDVSEICPGPPESAARRIVTTSAPAAQTLRLTPTTSKQRCARMIADRCTGIFGRVNCNSGEAESTNVLLLVGLRNPDFHQMLFRINWRVRSKLRQGWLSALVDVEPASEDGKLSLDPPAQDRQKIRVDSLGVSARAENCGPARALS